MELPLCMQQRFSLGQLALAQTTAQSRIADIAGRRTAEVNVAGRREAGRIRSTVVGK